MTEKIPPVLGDDLRGLHLGKGELVALEKEWPANFKAVTIPITTEEKCKLALKLIDSIPKNDWRHISVDASKHLVSITVLARTIIKQRLKSARELSEMLNLRNALSRE